MPIMIIANLDSGIKYKGRPGEKHWVFFFDILEFAISTLPFMKGVEDKC